MKMLTNWYVIIPLTIAVVLLIVFFINRNQKDKKTLMRELIDEDQMPKEVEPDTEINSEE
jgi:hypothetical protein